MVTFLVTFFQGSLEFEQVLLHSLQVSVCAEKRHKSCHSTISAQYAYSAVQSRFTFTFPAGRKELESTKAEIQEQCQSDGYIITLEEEQYTAKIPLPGIHKSSNSIDFACAVVVGAKTKA